MPVATRTIPLSTPAGMEVVELTSRIRALLGPTGLKAGTVTVFCPGATGGVTTIEYEPGLVQDFKDFFDRVIPEKTVRYEHNERWKDGNGHSHVRASLVGPSLTVPFADGKLLLGRWQEIVFVDFDVPPREREIVLQFIGE